MTRDQLCLCPLVQAERRSKEFLEPAGKALPADGTQPEWRESNVIENVRGVKGKTRNQDGKQETEGRIPSTSLVSSFVTWSESRTVGKGVPLTLALSPGLPGARV